MKAETFLGRSFDVNTQTWIHKDGSGCLITEEHRQEIYLALDKHPPVMGLFKLFEIKDRDKS